MRRLITSCFGLGFLPIAPGSWGSLPPVALFLLFKFYQVPVLTTAIVMVVLMLVSSVLCVLFTPSIQKLTGKTDPGEVVIDEFAGQCVVFAILAGQSNIWVTAIAGFLLFRFFDILKPPPIRKLEKLPAGWGVLLDDLLAGVYAGIAGFAFLRLYDVLCKG